MKNTYSDVKIPTIVNNSSIYIPKEISPQAKICLNCDWPAKKCHGFPCKRYNAELKKLNKG